MFIEDLEHATFQLLLFWLSPSLLLLAPIRRANAEGVYRIEWTPPPIVVTRQVAATTIVRRPERDLILLETFRRWYKCSPSDVGLPVAQIYQGRMPTLQGVLVRALDWNTPEGCRRISSQDEYCFIRSQEVARDDQELRKGDTDGAWKHAVVDMQVTYIA